MNTDVKKMLLDAWSENRLAAVHIDMQYLYHTGNEPTFRAVARFADRLRDYAVPNAWVAFPQLDMKYDIPPRITTVAEFNREAMHPDHTPQSMIHDMVGARSHEPVIVKDWGSAFERGEDSHLHRFLQDRKIDTVIIDGVAAYACVARTLDDGSLLDKYNFVVVEDCINMPQTASYADDVVWFGVKHESMFRRRFHAATSDTVINALTAEIGEIEQPAGSITLRAQTYDAVANFMGPRLPLLYRDMPAQAILQPSAGVEFPDLQLNS